MSKLSMTKYSIWNFQLHPRTLALERRHIFKRLAFDDVFSEHAVLIFQLHSNNERERARMIFIPAAQIGKNSSTSKLFIEKKTHHKQHFVKANNDDDDDLSVREFLQK